MINSLSIVVISMNNIENLKRCFDSILSLYSLEEYKLYLIAYNFSDENISFIRDNYPIVSIFQTNGILGFSENNNIALKSIHSKYCLILNDDTYFTDDSISKMYHCMNEKLHIKILSPKILNEDGSIQFLGRPSYNLFSYILHEFKLVKFLFVGDKSMPLFKTFNISGACFMICLEHFKKLNFFDEDYFFTPEDIALSTLSCRFGVNPFVLSEAKVYHIGSSTAKYIHQITIPVGKQGTYLFLRKFYGKIPEYIYRLFILFLSSIKLGFWLVNFSSIQRKKIMVKAYVNCIKYSFSIFKPKDLFIKLLHS